MREKREFPSDLTIEPAVKKIRRYLENREKFKTCKGPLKKRWIERDEDLKKILALGRIIHGFR